MKNHIICFISLLLCAVSCKSQSTQEENTTLKTSIIVVHPTFEDKIEGDSMEFVNSKIKNYFRLTDDKNADSKIQGDSIIITLPREFSEEKSLFLKRFLLSRWVMQFHPFYELSNSEKSLIKVMIAKNINSQYTYTDEPYRIGKFLESDTQTVNKIVEPIANKSGFGYKWSFQPSYDEGLSFYSLFSINERRNSISNKNVTTKREEKNQSYTINIEFDKEAQDQFAKFANMQNTNSVAILMDERVIYFLPISKNPKQNSSYVYRTNIKHEANELEDLLKVKPMPYKLTLKVF